MLSQRYPDSRDERDLLELWTAEDEDQELEELRQQAQRIEFLRQNPTTVRPVAMDNGTTLEGE